MRVVVAVLLLVAGCSRRSIELITQGEVKTLRARPQGAPPNAAELDPILVLGLDGVSRDLLYDMLRSGQLPHLAELLGGNGLAHAYFEDSMLTTMPSSTMAAWLSAFTGVPPAEHGVAGNEYFVRETRTFENPAPISFADADATLAIYTDGSVNKLFDTPTVYERLRAIFPDALIWVAMSQVYRGADWFLLGRKSIIVKALQGYIADFAERHLGDRNTGFLYAEVDMTAIGIVTDRLARGPLPDVLTIYVSGTDLLAHVARQGPDAARREYLVNFIDPAIGKLVARLRARNALANRWVIVTADHGHTPVLHDHEHALDAAPVAVLHNAGYRVRPMKRHVSAIDPFDAVLAYGQPTAYVYLADRSRCPRPHDVCPWAAPPRYEQDVLPAAEAFFRANQDGTGSPRMKGTIDMILTRQPRPYPEVDLPFEVYVGGGKTVPIDDYLAAHPHPTYVAMSQRLADLAVGVHGERAGDIMLLAHDGDRDRPQDRYYFARAYRSIHGSPSRNDSQIPLIVANAQLSAAAIGERVTRVLGGNACIERITDLILDLAKP